MSDTIKLCHVETGKALLGQAPIVTTFCEVTKKTTVRIQLQDLHRFYKEKRLKLRGQGEEKPDRHDITCPCNVETFPASFGVIFFLH